MSRLVRALRHLLGRQGPRGQSLVEFALTLPLFLLITMGVVDLGRGIVANTLVSNAAHEGARAGIFPVQSSTTTLAAANQPVIDAVNSQRGFLGQLDAWTSGAEPTSTNYIVISASDADGSNVRRPSAASGTDTLDKQRQSRNQIIVEVHYRFSLLTPLISRFVGNNINLSAKSAMMIE